MRHRILSNGIAPILIIVSSNSIMLTFSSNFLNDINFLIIISVFIFHVTFVDMRLTICASCAGVRVITLACESYVHAMNALHHVVWTYVI